MKFERKLATNGVTYYVSAINDDGSTNFAFPTLTGLNLRTADNAVDMLTLAYKLGSKEKSDAIIEFAVQQIKNA